MKLTRMLGNELKETLSRPGRVLNVFRPGRLAGYLRFQHYRWLARGGWSASGEALSRREIGSYDDYLKLQRSKLQYLRLDSHESRFRKALGERLGSDQLVRHGDRVLCLGARLGAEVAAFRDMGAFAIGVDLNPGQDNPWVLYGDFHSLEYPNACLDTVYSNSLDHCLEPARVLAEVRRLLVPGGQLLVEADPGVEDPNGIAPDMWATFQWKTVSALREVIEASGFAFVSERGFEYPRHGKALRFRRGE